MAGWEVEAPTAVLNLPCDSLDPSGPIFDPVPDLDGDGIGELFVAGDWPDPNYTTCQAHWLPADVTGTLDVPATTAPGIWLPPAPFGDQDGDGVGDFAWQGELLSPPLTEGSAGWEGRSLGLVADVYGASPNPLPGSLVGDDAPDFIAEVRLDRRGLDLVLLVAGGPAGGLLSGEIALHLIRVQDSGVAFVDGQVLSVEPQHVRVVALP